jgi:hypothetical protein
VLRVEEGAEEGADRQMTSELEQSKTRANIRDAQVT